MKKVIVIGCPGSGKSTLSRALHALTGIPLYHLDNMYWREDKTTVEKELFLERLEKVLDGDSWIIDGNYASTMEMRLRVCDTVIFLDYPTEVCLDGVRARKGMARSDMPCILSDDSTDFIDFIKKYNFESRPKVTELLEKHKDKDVFVLRSRQEADEMLKTFEKI